MDFNDLTTNVILQVTKKDLLTAFRSILSETNNVPEKEWMNLKEVSIYLGYKEPTVYKFVKDKKIPHYKRNGKLMFKKNDIDDWVVGGKVLIED